MLLGMTFAPDRTDTAISSPASASSEAISAAEFPIPRSELRCLPVCSLKLS